jgi:FkbM family methyltransferase
MTNKIFILKLKKIINKFFLFFNLKLTKISTHQTLVSKANFENKFNYIINARPKNLTKIKKYAALSKSQIFQDIFVLDYLNFPNNGFFVEFGAYDGKYLSNTYLLEKKFNWKGIVAEPAISLQKKLRKNRNCFKEFKCVYSESGKKLIFNETNSKELSTIDKFSNKDGHKNERLLGNKYTVETISLNDLLKKFNCPKNFEYLSMDTEGSEFEILKKLNFDYFSPKIITVEHNYNSTMRNGIYNLLTNNKYERILNNISLFDDWYIKKNFRN